MTASRRTGAFLFKLHKNYILKPKNSNRYMKGDNQGQQKGGRGQTVDS
jgi:hypothetical protein